MNTKNTWKYYQQHVTACYPNHVERQTFVKRLKKMKLKDAISMPNQEKDKKLQKGLEKKNVNTEEKKIDVNAKELTDKEMMHAKEFVDMLMSTVFKDTTISRKELMWFPMYMSPEIHSALCDNDETVQLKRLNRVAKRIHNTLVYLATMWTLTIIGTMSYYVLHSVLHFIP